MRVPADGHRRVELVPRRCAPDRLRHRQGVQGHRLPIPRGNAPISLPFLSTNGPRE
jgi:hypothetical protein